MNKWHALAVGLSSFLLSAFAGCSSTPEPVNDPKAPVSIDKWCATVTSRLCDLQAKACHKGSMEFANSCKDNGIATCNAGRDPSSPSGRTTGDLEVCLAKLEPLSCPAFEGIAGNKDVLAACSANAPALPAATAEPSSTATADPAPTATASPAPTATAGPATSSP